MRGTSLYYKFVSARFLPASPDRLDRVVEFMAGLYHRDPEFDPGRARREHRYAGDAREGLARLPRAGLTPQAALRSAAPAGSACSSTTSIGATSTRLRPRAFAR